MSNLVPLVRTCTEVSDKDHDQPTKPQPLKSFRSVSAYVLLGDPGAGKTTVFKDESNAIADALYITARNFKRLSVDSHPEWRDKTLFIDGLDEVRVGKIDVLTPFDEILSKLDALDQPRFRLSCREADWLGANDREHLADVAPDRAITVLRLDPLTDEDIIKILHAQQVADAHKFVKEAQKRGVGGLLTNPQTLKLLVQAVAGEDWPESRLETFERACRQMVRDRNKERQAANRGVRFPSADQLLNVAGRLCSVQLIADINGYTLDPDESDRDYSSPEECGGGIESEVYRAALASTYLFKAESDETCFIPVHRLIAEFLGAQHLAGLIAGGLPIQRVLALITGADGGVVTAMQGLAAWLAAQCPDARLALIERAPISVGLYGDIHQFSPKEKSDLLNALKHGGNRLGSVFRSRYWTAAFRPLATPDMEPALREILTDPARDQQHQTLTLFVLCLLEEGPPLSELSEPLLDMVRDNTRSPRVNTFSLDAFLHTCPNGQDKTDRLKQLLVDIQAGRVADPKNELTGTLLTWFYPRDLPASEVLDYLSESDGPDLMDGSFRFWSRGLLEQSLDEDVAELLDRLPRPPPGVRRALQAPRPYLGNLVLGLLARGLQAYGDKLSSERLYNWLDLGVFTILHNDHEPSQDVRAWLGQRPEIQKAIVTEGFQRAAQSPGDNPNGEIARVERHLYGANPPSDFGPWCGEQAKKVADLRIAAYFIRRADWAGRSLEAQREQARDRPELQRLISEMIDQSKVRQQEYRRQEQEYQREEQSYTEERKRQENEWLAYVRNSEIALRENRAAAGLLYELAKVYFRNFFSNDTGGPEAVERELQGDPSLTQASLQGLRDTLGRSDVPGLEATLSLRRKGRMHSLEWPFLVGLAEIERTAPEDAAQWDSDRIHKALAFYYCAPHGEYRPQWYRRLLEARPEAVADVQVRFAVSEFRGDSESIYKLWELAHDPAYVQVAQYASLPLLRAFPTRCKPKQLRELDNLLWAAIRYADRGSFGQLIEKKLSQTSMDDTQRTHWLAAGLIVSPVIYRERLRESAQGREKQLQQVATFFCDPEWESRYELGIPVPLEISTVELLIRLIGRYAGPDLRWEEGFVSSAMEASRRVDAYIQHLAASPAKEASDALALLCTDQDLMAWGDVLNQARDSQQVVRRDAEYRHPDVNQVCETLRNGPPANAADLVALVMDRLRQIAGRIRTENSNDWRHYWNEDEYGRPQNPKVENSCRDALIPFLEAKLPAGVDVLAEAKGVADIRSDIRVSWAGFNVPIEIKRNMHENLWSAMRDQLIEKYMQDTAASSRGIYLVLWFGTKKCQPRAGYRPESADELEKELKNMLSPDESRRVSVCVIDVTKPFSSASQRSG